MSYDLDVVVLLHGDGQYAPELLPEMLQVPCPVQLVWVV